MNKTALISGATSGIGRATALELASKGYNLVINGRRLKMLENLRNEIVGKYNTVVYISCFDVSDHAAAACGFEEINSKIDVLDVLINNAGLALGLNSIDEGNIEDWFTMIDTNIKGVLLLTKHALPLLKKSKCPQIINIGSIAGKETYPNGNVYCATKHAVDSLSKAMRIDFLKHDIRVTNLAPGAVETEFSIVRFKGDTDRAKNVYKGFTPLKPEDIAHIIGFIIGLPPHVNINDILVMPSQQATASIINKIE
ncbi:MAG: SDR family NAD(P)-dependent oxidoreductase [Bacteroidales bacterium]|nr:SDR family NAD(P)-dependent oxidoreductase [Bacteroidales bacterium]